MTITPKQIADWRKLVAVQEQQGGYVGILCGPFTALLDALEQDQGRAKTSYEQAVQATRDRDDARAKVGFKSAALVRARDLAVSLESMVHEARGDAEQVRAELAETAAISLALKLEVERLGAALTRYGRHASTCVPSRENPCTCGFKAALEGPK